MPPHAPPIGLKIKRRRKQLGLSQAGLARAVGISASYLNLIESNKRAIGGSLLLRIAERLQMDIEELSGRDEQRMSQAIAEMAAMSVTTPPGLAMDSTKMALVFGLTAFSKLEMSSGSAHTTSQPKLLKACENWLMEPP